MARAVITERLVEACTEAAALKKQLPFDTSVREAERASLTHALRCPVCQPIADTMRAMQAAETERLAVEARTEAARNAAPVLDAARKIIEANGYCRTYLWDTKQAADGVPIEYCHVDIIGAIAVALFDNPAYAAHPRVRRVEQFLEERIAAPSVEAWGSYPGNGKRAVLDLLRSTADELRTFTDTTV